MVHYRMAGPMLFHLHSRPGCAYCFCASGPIAHPMVPSSMVSWFINLCKTIKTPYFSPNIIIFSYFPICSHYFWSFLVQPHLCRRSHQVSSRCALQACGRRGCWDGADGSMAFHLGPGGKVFCMCCGLRG